jgi:Zn finger protein HypA/HybF involved in hydrogenase expression
MKEIACSMCGKFVRATDDDEFPLCDKCQGEEMELKLHNAIMDGEMDHVIPGIEEADQ